MQVLNTSVDGNRGQIGPICVNGFRSIEEAAEALVPPEGPLFSGALIAINAEKLLRCVPLTSPIAELQEHSLFYPDGAPVARLLRKQGIQTVRIAGTDLWLELMKRAADRNLTVFLVGATESVNARTAALLSQRYRLKSIVRQNGFFSDEETVFATLRDVKPDIVTVGLGSPRQEYLIRKMIDIHPSALYMGVGGTYDVFCGDLKRAPRWMRRMGLEWAFRVFRQPSRIPRYKSLLVFAWHYARGRFG